MSRGFDVNAIVANRLWDPSTETFVATEEFSARRRQEAAAVERERAALTSQPITWQDKPASGKPRGGCEICGDPEAGDWSSFFGFNPMAHGILCFKHELEYHDPELEKQRVMKIKEKEERKAEAATCEFTGKKLYPTQKTSPRKAGTRGHASYLILLEHPGIRYEEYLELGGRKGDLTWDLERKWVEVKDGKAEPTVSAPVVNEQPQYPTEETT